VIRLADTKSAGPQLVARNPPARPVLKTLETERRRSEWVVPSVPNPKPPISKAGIESAWRKLTKAAQIEDVRMHDLRHTVGSHADKLARTLSSCATCCGIRIWR
jgi:integrase